MRKAIALIAVVMAATATFTFAGPHKPRPRTFEDGRGFFKPIEVKGAPQTVRKTPALVWYGAWATSERMDDLATTWFYWCESESLGVVGTLYTTSAQTVSVTTNVYSTSNALVTSDEQSGTAEGLTGFLSVIGRQPAGSYKVVVKAKLGSKVVGHQFWMYVLPDSDPACHAAHRK